MYPSQIFSEIDFNSVHDSNPIDIYANPQLSVTATVLLQTKRTRERDRGALFSKILFIF